MTIQTIITAFTAFLGERVIPLLIAIAFLIFLFNLARYFTLHSQSEDGRARARQLALWGFLALVLLTSIWGVVQIFTTMLDIGGDPVVAPDYGRRGN
jgi:uncharacterized membrane protein YidH (DUF202 family)